MEFQFNPEVTLEREEVAQLASLVAQPGFKSLQKIMRSGVDQFTVRMLNAGNEEEVIAGHKLAKAAAMYYTWVTNTLTNSIAEYVYSVPNDNPVESAENLDIGDSSEFEEEEPLF